jgi:molybdopterin synthase catalytic subunit
MNVNRLIENIRCRPDYDRVGMILCHNGVVRGTSRDGRRVKGLTVAVDHRRLEQILSEYIARAGIVDIQVQINENRYLHVGEDVMVLAVAGDIRENVIAVFREVLDAVKSTVTRKTEDYL